jgi:hypothetical protein
MSMTLFEALRDDHALQRGLMRQLAGTRGNSPRRALLWGRLKDELAAHAKAEEHHLYVPLTEHARSQDRARQSIAEHHELDELVAALDATDMASPVWLSRARHLCGRVEHHLTEEERQVFPLAAEVLDAGDTLRFAEDYLQAMQDGRHAA